MKTSKWLISGAIFSVIALIGIVALFAFGIWQNVSFLCFIFSSAGIGSILIGIHHLLRERKTVNSSSGLQYPFTLFSFSVAAYCFWMLATLLIRKGN